MILRSNRAHLQYEISEDERIAPCLNSTKAALLQETLAAHRLAVSLNGENIDAQFNTGQVLSSLAETLLETEVEADAKNAARDMLEEACDLFTKCLGAQQRQYELTLSELAELSSKHNGSPSNDRDLVTESHAASDEQNDMLDIARDSSITEEWAVVEEALTPESILETCTAQLGALTTLLGLYDLEDLPSLEQRTKYARFVIVCRDFPADLENYQGWSWYCKDQHTGLDFANEHSLAFRARTRRDRPYNIFAERRYSG